MNPTRRVALSILGVRENGTWCAIALEMSLRGYGKTFEEALDNLKETIIVQVQYAREHHNNIEHILIPAEPRYFKIYKTQKREYLKNIFSNRMPSQQSKYMARAMPIPRIKHSSTPQPQLA